MADHGSRGRLIAVVISTNSAEKMPTAGAGAAACHAVEREHEREPAGTSKRPARAVVDQGKAGVAKKARSVRDCSIPTSATTSRGTDCQSDLAN